jgi:alpha-galactosidase
VLRNICCVLLASAAAALLASAVRDNGLARTPPMGWISHSFGERIDDATVRAIADSIDANGMRQTGYSYLVIGDAWQGPRNGEGDPHPNERFPDIRALASYVHSRGLFIGISSSPGIKTCLGYEGSYGHEEQDARVFAEWKIDFLEYSRCAGDKLYDNEASLRAAYLRMGEDLRRTGRPIVYSLGDSGKYDVPKWGTETGANLWRTSGNAEALTEFAGPGHWNNRGPLLIAEPQSGRHRVKDDPALRAQMTMWAMLAAPLFVEGDPRSYSATALAALTNREVIAVDQDPAGTPGFRRSANNGLEVWTRFLADGGKAVAWINHRDARVRFEMNWSDFGVDSKSAVRDLWQHRVLDTSKPEVLIDVDTHDVMMVRVYTAQ